MNLSLFQAFGNILYAIGQILDIGAEAFLGVHHGGNALVGGAGDVQFGISIR